MRHLLFPILNGTVRGLQGNFRYCLDAVAVSAVIGGAWDEDDAVTIPTNGSEALREFAGISG